MAAELKQERFLLAQISIGGLFSLFLTYISLAIADHNTTLQLVRYVLSPGYVLGLRFASGDGFRQLLGSFGRIAVGINMIYFGMICFFLLWKINWPKRLRNPRHRFWMER